MQSRLWFSFFKAQRPNSQKQTRQEAQCQLQITCQKAGLGPQMCGASCGDWSTTTLEGISLWFLVFLCSVADPGRCQDPAPGTGMKKGLPLGPGSAKLLALLPLLWEGLGGWSTHNKLLNFILTTCSEDFPPKSISVDDWVSAHRAASRQGVGGWVLISNSCYNTLLSQTQCLF